MSIQIIDFMNEKNILPWHKDKFLSWSDFKAESNHAVYEDSHSYINYHCTWTVNSEKIENDIMFSIIDIQLHVHFHFNLSWVRESEISDALLLHEQGHFDLAEQLREEYLSKIQNIFSDKKYHTRGQNESQQKQFAKEDSGKLISKEIEKLENLFTEKRNEYDKLTNFGHNSDEQLKFNQIFDKLH